MDEHIERAGLAARVFKMGILLCCIEFNTLWRHAMPLLHLVLQASIGYVQGLLFQPSGLTCSLARNEQGCWQDPWVTLVCPATRLRCFSTTVGDIFRACSKDLQQPGITEGSRGAWPRNQSLPDHGNVHLRPDSLPAKQDGPYTCKALPETCPSLRPRQRSTCWSSLPAQRLNPSYSSCLMHARKAVLGRNHEASAELPSAHDGLGVLPSYQDSQ